ncbi:MAG: hypothetical protein NXY57DRAFT_966996 [Lentinula lateritia]|nr:MAG: hypothetical protein NXY57DRAFT_966996 [Lentinula lateritia]
MTVPYASTSAGVSDALGIPPSSPNRRDSDVDEIVSNVEEPSLGQLSLFKSVFGIGISLAPYIIDDPLWSILAAAGLPCPTCCTFDIFPASALATWLSLVVSWRSTETRSTNSTSALLELNPLDDQDQRELDCQELREFCQHQPLVPGPSTLVPHTSPLAGGSSLLPPAPVMKKRKRLVKVDPGSTPKRRRLEQVVDRSSPIVPTVPQVEGGSSYRRVVLVLRPPHVPDSEIPTLPGVGHLVPEDSSHRSVVDQSRSQGYTKIPPCVPQAGLFEQFVPPSEVEDFSWSRIKTPPVQQRSREPLRPYPRSQASSALRVDNDHLKTEVEELRTLLAQSRDTSSSLDLRSQELEASRRSLEEVARDHAEYQRVLSQFRAIEAELPEPASEDLVTCFLIAHSEVAKRQKQEIGELRKQVDDASSHSSNAYAELDSANARGLLEAITLLLYRGLHHTPERLSSTVDLVLGYLSQARFTHADRVEGLYQEMLTHSRFPSHDTFLTATQHAGYVDARPGSLEPPLHRRFFSFDHPIPITPSPTSDHLPAVPAMDSIMVSWERLIANYIRNMIDTPGPHYFFPTSAELPGIGGGPSPLEGSVLAEGDDDNAPREVEGVTGETGVALHLNVATPAEEDNRDPPVGGSETPSMARTPLFLPASCSPSSPLLIPSVPVVPHITDLTMIDDNGKDLYESHEEFEARMQGDVAVKNERSSPTL